MARRKPPLFPYVLRKGRKAIVDHSSLHPLDRTIELHRDGFTMAGLLDEAAKAGYRITERMVWKWVENGLLPYPKPDLKVIDGGKNE